MICHCCGQRYIEFFPNAKQENLFIGMIHAFLYMGIPEYVLTDNMKSVVIRRDEQGHPIWQKDYELFMGNLGFETKLCKPRHPFTKGSVERLIRFVKENFLPGRVFNEITDLNYVDCIPNDKRTMFCMKNASVLEESIESSYYLCPERKISFDGFVHYEGCRFKLPYWYTEKTCRVKRDGYIPEISLLVFWFMHFYKKYVPLAFCSQLLLFFDPMRTKFPSASSLSFFLYCF